MAKEFLNFFAVPTMEPTSRELLQLYQTGQDDAASEIFNRYVGRLVGLVRARIGSKLNQRLDPEDIVQSTFRSFFVRAQNDEYQLQQPGDLWRLLAQMTLHKLYGQSQKHSAAKRTVHRESANELAMEALITPSNEEVIAAEEQLKLVFSRLNANERQVVVLVLQGYEIEEICQTIGKSKRSVRRFLAQAKQQLEFELLDSTSSVETNHTNQIGQTHPELEYSDFVLQQLLGSGGMGKVYRAKNKRTGNTVAVKALRKSWQTSQRAVTQFVREAQILSELNHPNIIGFHGIGRFPAGGYFIVMDHVEGSSLEDKIKLGPLPPEEVIEICISVASGVEHVHQQGLVHCDIKPGNVLVSRDGEVLITDFGFSHWIAELKHGAPKAMGGTEGYIAPEILEHQKLSPAADIFSLGILLWELVSGKIAFDFHQPAENTRLNALHSICSKCLSREPDKRYPSAKSLTDALVAARDETQ